MERMLSRVPDALDKREGAIIFDALAPAAFEMSILYTELETALDQTFADTCQGVYLDKRCMERGITRQQQHMRLFRELLNRLTWICLVCDLIVEITII